MSILADAETAATAAQKVADELKAENGEAVTVTGVTINYSDGTSAEFTPTVETPPEEPVVPETSGEGGQMASGTAPEA